MNKTRLVSGRFRSWLAFLVLGIYARLMAGG